MRRFEVCFPISFFAKTILSHYWTRSDNIIKLGGTFNVERLKTDELKVGVVQSSWLPRVNHPGLSPEQIKALATMLLPGMLFSISAGCMKVTDEWNQLLPDYKFTKTEEFLSAVWCDKL